MSVTLAVTLAVGTGILVALVVARLTLIRVTVDGASMEPTLRHGSRVLVRRAGPASVRVGAVVVLEIPPVGAPATTGRPTPRWVIKRVAAGPGDPMPGAVAAAVGAPPGSRVPAGHVAVLGDNPDWSVDSRHYGPVGLDRVLGVAVDRRLG